MKKWLLVIWMVSWSTTEAKRYSDTPQVMALAINLTQPPPECVVYEQEHTEKFYDEDKAKRKYGELEQDKTIHDLKAWKMERIR